MTPTNICPRCGGKINKFTLTCDYCDTSFLTEQENACIAYADDIPLMTGNDPHITICVVSEKGEV